jgi:long-subunit acyl-CoA synthetase (AMP-forming)
VVAIVVPDPIKLAELAKTVGIENKSHEELCKDPKIKAAVLEEVTNQAKVLLNHSITFSFVQLRDFPLTLSTIER